MVSKHPPPLLSSPVAPGPVLPPATRSSPPCPTNWSNSPHSQGEPAFPQGLRVLCAVAPSSHTDPPRKEPPRAPQHTASQAEWRQGRSSTLQAWPQPSSLTPRTGPPMQGPVKAPDPVPRATAGSQGQPGDKRHQADSLRPWQPCIQHASTLAQPSPHPLGFSLTHSGSGAGFRQWQKGSACEGAPDGRHRGPPAAGGLSRLARSREPGAGGQQLGQKDSWEDAGWRPGEAAPRESELLPPGCLAAALPAALMGLGQASLWPWQAMLLAGPAMVPVDRGTLGCREDQGKVVTRPGAGRTPLPQERAVRSSWKHLETPGAHPCPRGRGDGGWATRFPDRGCSWQPGVGVV